MASKTQKRVVGAASAAVMAATAAFVAPWEGLYTRPYRDIVGVVTVCYGETEGVKMTDKPRTPKQCAEMLAAKLPRYYNQIAKCWGPDVDDVLTDNQRIAFTSGAYNFGSGAFCKSSMVERLKRGDMIGACNALLLYNKAGGRIVKGLVNRRAAERKLCVTDLGEPPYLPRPKLVVQAPEPQAIVVPDPVKPDLVIERPDPVPPVQPAPPAKIEPPKTFWQRVRGFFG